ncbi:MAG: RHS repeat-associated core domain-containing protein [Acidimicrobiales bacterium]
MAFNQGSSQINVTSNITGNPAPTWTHVTTGVVSDPWAAACGSATSCVVLGLSGDGDLLTQSGGTWTSTTFSTGISTSGFDSVSCPSATMCMATGIINGRTSVVASLSISGSTVTTHNLSGEPNLPTLGHLMVACDTTTSCSVFNNYGVPNGAQTTDGGATFSAIVLNAPPQSLLQSVACGGAGACFAVGRNASTAPAGPSGAGFVLSTNGVASSTFLPGALLPAESFGGPDGSRPCFACELKAAGLSAQGFVAEPINTSDGDFFESVPIVTIPGNGPNLAFTATYDSDLAQTEVANSQNPGPLGWGWSGTTFISLLGAGGGGNLTLDEEGGAQITYLPSATGPGFDGGTCSSGASLQCYTASAGDVTAVLEGAPLAGAYTFSRDGGRTLYNLNSSGQLASIIDSNGDSESFAYNVTTGTNCSTAGTACDTETDAAGRVLDIVYNTSSGLVSTVIDPAGRTWNFAYDSNSNLTSMQNPLGNNETFGYDTASTNPTMVHNMTSLTPPNGQPGAPDAGHGFTIAYQESATSTSAPLGYVLSQTDPAGIVTSFTYTGNYASPTGGAGSTGTTAITTAKSGTTLGVADDIYVNGILMAHITGVGTQTPATTGYVRNALGMPTTIIDADGNSTTYSYDPNGNLLSATDPTGNTTSWTYNAFNEPISKTDPIGIQTSYTYDTAGNPTSEVVTALSSRCSTGCTETTTYRPCESSTCSVSGNSYTQGELESVTDARGYTTTYSYDSSGDRTSATDPVGNKSVDVYDSIGRVFCSIAPVQVAAGNTCAAYGSHGIGTTSYTLDAADHVLTATNPNAQTSTNTYDPDGNQLTATDPLSNETLNAYDADDRLTKTTTGYGSSAAQSTTTAYDLLPGTSPCSASVTGATYCNTTIGGTGLVTVNYFNALNEEIKASNPGSLAATSLTYDNNGNVLTQVTGGGTTTTTYDADNRPLSVAPSGNQSGYSAAGNVSYQYDADGMRTQMIDSTGTTTYSYDGYEHLLTTQNGAGSSVSYGYDLDNNETSIEYPNSQTVTRSYNNAEQLTGVTDWNGNTTTVTPDGNGNTETIGYPSSTDTDTYSFDAANVMTAATIAPSNSPSITLSYTPNADGQVGSVSTTNLPGPSTANYTYNGSSGIATDSVLSTGYSYDAAGNSTQLGNGIKQLYNSSGEMCDAATSTPSCTSPPTQSSSETYNTIGDRSSTTMNGVSTTYSYNQLGQMIGSSSPASTTSFAYNGDGIRMSTTVGSTTSQFAYDVSSSVPAILTDGTWYYVYGPIGPGGQQLPIEQINVSSGTTYYLHHDVSGSTVAITSSSGQAVGTMSYDPYGNLNGQTGTVTSPIGFAGGYLDSSTGLYYLVNRYYDPTTAQFLSIDPLVAETGQSYQYAGDDPVNASDPSGLITSEACAGNGPIGRSPKQEAQDCADEQKQMKAISAQECANDPTACASSQLYVSGCFSLAVAEVCLAAGGGSGYLQAGPGFGTPGASLSVGTVNRGPISQVLGGWSVHAGGQYWVGGGWARSLGCPSANGPFVSVGTPGAGAFRTYGVKLW